MTRRKTHEEFLEQCSEMINQGYKVLSQYKDNKSSITFECPHGHIFQRMPKAFLKYKSCPKCNNKQKITINDFKDLIKKEANNEYEILDNEIKNVHQPIKIKHKTCGHEYKVSYTNFQTGKRCPKCAKELLKEICIINGRKNMKTDEQFKQEVYELVGDEYIFLEEYKGKREEILCRHKTCGHEFKINPDYFKSYLKKGNVPCPKCKVVKDRSLAEDEIYNFLLSFYDKTILINDRTILNGSELDIYLPEDKLAIEYNGLYWHSEEGSNGKCDRWYHYNKTKQCQDKGIRLIHIYEHEWYYKKDIIKSKLKYILGYSKDLERIYARKCIVKAIDKETKDNFLNNHHIQGCDKATTINLGLYYNDILIAVMTFTKENKINNDYKLSRYASDNNYILNGGFSKLLKYFINNYNYDDIYTFADRTWSIGDLYDKNNFIVVNEVNPDYKYYHRDELELYHKFGFRKDKIKKLFPDIYDENKTEKEMMKEAGYLRVWNCGLIKYKYNK